MEDEKKISVQKAMALLQKDGYEVNEEEAKAILDFLYLIAEIVVQQHFNDQR